MTLWIFGDSYAQANNVPEQWMYKTANELNTEVKSLATNGTALEFTYQRFNIARKRINKNDVVVIVLTDFDRRWFFKQYPEFAEKDVSPTDNKKENKAIRLYRDYLDHKEIHRTYLLDFLYNLHSLTEELSLHTIVLPVFADVEEFLTDKKDFFPLFNFAEGKLIDIAKNTDVNLNYMTQNVHEILTQKLLDNIKNNTAINLKKGF